MTTSPHLTALLGLTQPRRGPASDLPAVLGHTAERLLLPFEGEHLTVWRWGNARRRVLLIHGWEDDSRLWQAWVGAYLARGVQVLSLDLPAHGHSTGTTTTVVQCGRAVAEVAAQLGSLDQAVGHSMGSAALLSAFQRGLQVAHSVHIAGPSVLTHVVHGAAQHANLSPADTATFVGEFEHLIGSPTTDWDIGALASGLCHPGLIAHDPADRRVPFAESVELHVHWPRSILLPLEDTGHRRIVDSAELQQRALEAFPW
ncbi:alpha/beta fold hydrolase [Deinococcus alpinitundrae]|uniref:alpha/beta fold hydrolase n=1 Tax=Deinococcus alpinitundrae TaxID=468913 RepID=UPI00137B91DD|nr:alpha/beta hydrolase [Deinococcus alpinitundrae]